MVLARGQVTACPPANWPSRRRIEVQEAKVLFRVIDIETTGMSPPAEIIEIGRVDVVRRGDAIEIERPMARLYRPLRGIPPENMAIHHITPSDFDEHTPVCTTERLQMAVWGGTPPDVLVAHNCEFERRFISDIVTKGLPWICTFKVALRVWPDAPRHTNQVLRYWRSLALDPAVAMPPHRAGPDAWVTAHLLAELLKTTSATEMIAWTAQPAVYPMMPIGRYRGKAWREVPTEYLAWLIERSEVSSGIKFCARSEIARRQKS